MTDWDGDERRPARVVVHHVVNPEGGIPFRRVTIMGQEAGKAYGVADVVAFIRRAGLDDVDVDDPGLIDWEGGGPTVWE